MINRIPDKEAIEGIYRKYSGKSALLIIYAKTGVGKSLLTDNIFSDKLECSYVRIQINQQQAEEAKGFYLSCLSKSLNNYAHTTGRFATIEEFVDNIYEINKDGEKVINDLLDIAAILVNRKDLREKLTQPKRFKEELIKKVLESDNDIAISFLLAYILHISKNSRIILSIENIQQANTRLISFLNELLKKTENLFLVGEYTVHNSEFEVTTLFRQFPYESTSVYELKKLDKQELIGGIQQVIDNEHVEAVRKIIENSYDESAGNLANLQFLIKKSTLSLSNKDGSLKTIKYDDALHSVYNSLTNQQRISLWYIVTHWGRVNIATFSRFMEGLNADFSFSEILNTLHDLNLIHIGEDHISLVHDSQIELLKAEEDSRKFMAIANKSWLNFYRNVCIQSDFGRLDNTEINNQDLLTLQLSFILSIGGNSNLDWMNIVLSEISKSTSGSFSNALITKVVHIFYQIVDVNANQLLVYKTYEWIVIILSKLGYWEEIARIASRYKFAGQTDLITLLHATAKVATCDTTVYKELKAITDKQNDFLYTGAQLLLLRYYRTFSQISKARHVWNQLLLNSDGSPYQYIITDQVNLCSLNFRKRQQLLQVASQGHLEQGNIYQYCSTLLNINSNSYYLYLTRIMSKRKYLRIASENLQTAKDILGETHYPIHVYMNQKSVFQFVENKTSPAIILDNLRSAYLNCGITGNRPLIGSNIVAVGLKYKKLEDLDFYVEELMQLSRKYSELNSEFSKYPLINCYNYYHKTKNRQGQKEALRLFRKNSSLNDISDYIMATPIVNEVSLRLIRYYPCNISNWDIDFESIYSKF